MLTREAALLLISLSGWTLFISALLYQPFIFLASFFLQTFFTIYILLADRRLRKISIEGFKVERTAEPQRIGDKTLLKVILHVRFDSESQLFVRVIDKPPYGTRVVGQQSNSEGIVGAGESIESSYTLEIDSSIGLARFRKVILLIHDPLKLCYVARELEVASDIIVPVGEQLVGAAYTKLSAGWIRPPMGLGYRGLVGYDDEFSGTKPYELGDRIRDIHWMRYAQQVDDEGLVAKKYVKRGEVTLHIVIDCSSSINTGDNAALLTDISILIRRLCQTAEEEGNPVQFWLINPLLSHDEKISPRRVFSRVALEQYIARVFPSNGRDDGKIVEEFLKTLGSSSIVIFVVNPPSQNTGIVEAMINACRIVGARYIICMPDVSSYISGLDGEASRLLQLDRLYKDKWLSRFSEPGTVIEIGKGYAVDLAKEAMRRGVDWGRD
ncbi:hypothetical protein HRbin02_01447 [Candidatus Calditenuaceae archaeon HR02]|nr:hypothetical protein HRbin02_01447 [Candidatus Calditenuaceae archaeon HR02]